MEKNKKSHTKTINLKCQLQHGMENLIYLKDRILAQIFKIILNVYIKKTVKKAAITSIRIYMNKIENRIEFEIKTVYYL